MNTALRIILTGMVLAIPFTQNILSAPANPAQVQPANSKANVKARAILRYFYNLREQKEKNILSGQFTDFGNGANLNIMEQVAAKTGQYPAIYGADYADFRTGGLTTKAPNRAAIQYWNQGGLVTFNVHLYNPANPKGGGLRDRGVDMNDLLRDGTETHQRWMKQLDQISEGFQELKEAGVVILWRPFHEMNGAWFWWGAPNPEAFKNVWRHMFEYFSGPKNLDNLLWLYGPNHGEKTAAYYPGDAFVDLVGIDAYTDFIDPQHIKGVSEVVALGKPFGFTEFGPFGSRNPPGNYDYMKFIAGIEKYFPETCYFMSWNAKWSLASNQNTRELLNHPRIANRADLPADLFSRRVFHVSPKGNDTWSGLLGTVNDRGTDGPFATLAKARDTVRELKKKNNQPVRILIQGGTYYLKEPLLFTDEDSGSASNPVEYMAVKGQKPVFSGGRKITGWKLNDNLWVTELPEVSEGKWDFRQLWVNGERRQRARHPNEGYLKVESLIDVKPDAPWTDGQASFRYGAGDLKKWEGLANIEVRVMNRWVESHLPVVGIDETNRTIRFSKRSVFKLEPGDLYYAENAREFLDQPGEWHLDRKAGKLYYWPKTGEQPETTEVIAPVLSQLIRLEGQPEKNQFIEYLTFRGLTFAHTEWYFPKGFDQGKDKAEVWPPPQTAVGGFAQAAVGVPGSVKASGVRHSEFNRCRFEHLGGYGLELARGCQENRITGCVLNDLGAGGIKIGETAIRKNLAEVTSQNEISDCQIHDGGKIFHSGIGLWIGQSPGNRISHNEIHNFYYSGISVGWTWGYSEALATNTLVEFNHVHHIGKLNNGDGPTLSDMAGIYTLGLHRGSVIRNNLWHDVAGLRYGGWGIYFDEGTTEILAENNLVMRTTHGGFHQHYGKNNVVRNNVFVDARDFQIQRSRAEEHRSFTFERNIVYWKRGKLLEGNFSGTNYVMQSNLYWHETNANPLFVKSSFADWQKTGQDTKSLIANPQFVNDFTISTNSPARTLGFRQFNLNDVGVRYQPD